MTVTSIILGIFTGLALASIYALIAISLNIVLASSGVFNFAQGTLVMLGTVLTFIFGQKLGWTPLATIGTVGLLGALGGIITHIVAVLPAMGRSRSFSHTTMLTTIGLGTAANAAVALLFGSDSHRVPSYVSENPIVLLGVPLRPTYLVMIGIGLILTIAIEWTLRRTEVGHVFRITLEDTEGARLLGVDTVKVIALAFAVAGVMSGLAGYLIAPVIAASAFTAQELAFYGFAGMAIGGFGSFAGALIGGIIVGIIAGVTPIVASPQITLPLIWIVVVITLLIKPKGLCGTSGLFGAARIREV